MALQLLENRYFRRYKTTVQNTAKPTIIIIAMRN